VTGGGISLHDGLTIEATDELAGVARWLRQAVEQSMGWRVEISGHARPSTTSGNVVRLVLERGDDRDEHRSPVEGYRLKVGDDAVTVTASGPAGVFYGLQTFRRRHRSR
jgi:hexosaminidase